MISRKKQRKSPSGIWALCLVLTLMLTAGIGSPAVGGLDTPSDIAAVLQRLVGLPLEAFFEEAFRAIMLRDPEAVSVIGLDAVFGMRNDRLTSLDPDYIDETHAFEQEVLRLLRGYDRSSLSPTQQVWYDCFAWNLDAYSLSVEEIIESPLLSGVPRYSLPADLEALFFWHPLRTPEDADDYIARLAQVPMKVEQMIRLCELQIENGYRNPGTLLEASLGLIDRILGIEGRSVELPSSILTQAVPAYQDFVFRLAETSGLELEQRQVLIREAQDRYAESFVPAFWDLRQFVKELLESAEFELETGLYAANRPGYEAELRAFVSTDLTPETIHVLAQLRVGELLSEIRDAMLAKGFSDDGATVPNFIELVWRRLNARSGLLDGEKLVARLDQLVAEAKKTIDQVFQHGTIEEPVIRRSDGGTKGESGYYYLPPAFDGTRPGTFFIGEEPVSRSLVPHLVFHELVPGHHLQRSLANALDIPLFMKAWRAPGYTEGWAGYSERLMFELGGYSTEDGSHLVRLYVEFLEAVTTVIETGLHALGWDRARAAGFWSAAVGLPISPDSVLFDEYAAFPARDTAYFVGRHTILRLRDRAEQSLGPAFDLPAFHAAVIGYGNVPLVILDRLVSCYIAESLPSPIQDEADGTALELVTLWR